MGLRFCNEAVMCLKQIYQPMSDKHENEALTPLQVRVVICGCPWQPNNSVSGYPLRPHFYFCYSFVALTFTDYCVLFVEVSFSFDTKVDIDWWVSLFIHRIVK